MDTLKPPQPADKRKPDKSISLRAFFSLPIFITIVLAILSTLITFISVEQNVRINLIQKNQSVARLLEPYEVITVNGDSSDLKSTTYTHLKEHLMSIVEYNPLVRFMYVLAIRGSKIVFLADSEKPTSKDYSAPGDEYAEASKTLKSVFQNNKPETEIASDKWGYWLSAFAPIRDPSTHQIIAVLGMDVDAISQYYGQILLYSSLPFGIFAFILLVLFYNRKYALLQAEAIAEKNGILHITSHEVRTPITHIRWSCESMLEDEAVQKNESVKSTIAEIYQSTFQINTRISDLEIANSLSQSQHFESKEVEVAHLLDKITTSLAPLTKIHEITIYTDYNNQQSLVNGNEELLTTALQNVILNLIFYGKDHTGLTIVCTTENDEIVVTLRGEGDPIPDEELKTLFLPFHRESKFTHHIEATGLGLYLVKKIITLHNGAINVVSKDTKTTFTITLPKAE